MSSSNYLYPFFLDNKYTKWYFSIINNAKLSNRIKLNITYLDYIYYESHHIIPKSFTNDNSRENLVLLTAKEHFLCHKLLVRMTEGKYKSKMIHALNRMCNSNRKVHYNISPKDYDLIRKMHSKNVSKSMKGNKHCVGRVGAMLNKNHSDDVKHKISKTLSEKYKNIEHPNCGRTHNEEVRKRISISVRGRKWWNNGEIQVMCKECPIGDNWVNGRLNFSEINKQAQLKRKPISDETRKKMSLAHKGLDVHNKNKFWWNNGIINKCSIECPEEGFVKGMLTK